MKTQKYGSFRASHTSRKGLTGLETAIILIAFIIVASTFAFTVLNMGFQTSQRAGQVIGQGMQEASSALELDGSVVAYGDTATSPTYPIKNITFTVSLSAGQSAIDLSDQKLTIAYTSPYMHIDNVYAANSTAGAIVKEIVGNSNNLLENGEKFKVTVFTNGATIADTHLTHNDQFTIELKPASGSVLTVTRILPPAVDYSVINLG